MRTEWDKETPKLTFEQTAEVFLVRRLVSTDETEILNSLGQLVNLCVELDGNIAHRSEAVFRGKSGEVILNSLFECAYQPEETWDQAQARHMIAPYLEHLLQEAAK